MSLIGSQLPLETVNCVLCGSQQSHVVVCQRDLSFDLSDQEFTVVCCDTCRLLYLNPRPTVSDIQRCYPPEYYPPANDEAACLLTKRTRKVPLIKQWLLEDYYGYPSMQCPRSWVTRFRKLLLFPEWAQRKWRGKNLLPYVGEGRLLDVGCGPGKNLETFDNLGWEVFGVEMSEAAALQARKRFPSRIHWGTLEDAHFDDHTFDVIAFNHSLEHMFHPVETLVLAKKLLRPGGMIVITVPNAGSVEARLFGRWWYPWELPRHLYHFDRQSIVKVLEKAGLAVRKLETGKGSLFFMASLQRYAGFVWNCDIPGKKIFERFVVRPLTLVFGHLGYGNEIRVYAVIKANSECTTRSMTAINPPLRKDESVTKR